VKGDKCGLEAKSVEEGGKLGGGAEEDPAAVKNGVHGASELELPPGALADLLDDE